MISGVIVKSGENFRLDPDYGPAPLPLPLKCVPAVGIIYLKYLCNTLMMPMSSSIHEE